MISRWFSWGGTDELGSHRHILRHYHEAAGKMGIPSLWLRDAPENNTYLSPGAVVFAFDVAAQHLGPAVPGVKYVLHNFPQDHITVQTCHPDYLLRLQVYTDDALGDQWDDFRYYYPEGHLLFQPWGTNLLAEEFYDPIFNSSSTDVPFVGAVWSEMHDGRDLGNEKLVEWLKIECSARNLRFIHKTHISDQENIDIVRRARIAPALAGGWQVDHNYLPCRVFKNISYGALGITNVPKIAEAIGCPPDKSFEWGFGLRSAEYTKLVKAQQRFAAKYTYRQSIESIDRALKERDV